MKTNKSTTLAALALTTLFGLSTLAFADHHEKKKDDDTKKPVPTKTEKADPKKDDAKAQKPEAKKPEPKKEAAKPQPKKETPKAAPKKEAPKAPKAVAVGAITVTVKKAQAKTDAGKLICPKCKKPCPAGKPCPEGVNCPLCPVAKTADCKVAKSDCPDCKITKTDCPDCKKEGKTCAKCEASKNDKQKKAVAVQAEARAKAEAMRQRMDATRRDHEQQARRGGPRDERPQGRGPAADQPLLRVFHLGEAVRHLHAAGAHEQAEAIEKHHLHNMREHHAHQERAERERNEIRERAMREVHQAREAGAKEMRAVLDQLKKAVEELTPKKGGH